MFNYLHISQPKSCVHFSLPPSCNMLRLSHPPQFDNYNHFRCAQMMKPLILYFSPVCCYFLPNFRSPRSCVSASHWRSADRQSGFSGHWTLHCHVEFSSSLFVRVRHCREVVRQSVSTAVNLFVCGWVIVGTKMTVRKGARRAHCVLIWLKYG